MQNHLWLLTQILHAEITVSGELVDGEKSRETQKTKHKQLKMKGPPTSLIPPSM
jgi:hypothetical protein